MNVAIVGIQGIPAQYGGFETLVENLIRENHSNIKYTVYCSGKTFKFRIKTFKDASLEYIPLKANGIQSIPYDILSLFKAARKNDSILILGISGCISLPVFRLFYPRKKLIINIDGLEHKRSKWKPIVQRFLKLSEKIAIRFGNEIIADNKAIQSYIKKEYNRESHFIAYGGDHVQKIPLSHAVKLQYRLPDVYALKVCRIEPENNIEMILNAFAEVAYPLIIIGNWNKSDYGKKIKLKFQNRSSIQLLDAIYDQDILNQIRSNCSIYIHGHSAGGTNPSLVEAMHLSLPVFAFDVSYNRETTHNQAQYFSNAKELISLINQLVNVNLNKLGEIMEKIAKVNYSWKLIAHQYEELLCKYFKD